MLDENKRASCNFEGYPYPGMNIDTPYDIVKMIIVIKGHTYYQSHI